MALTIRGIAPDELETMLAVDRRGFGGGPEPEGASRAWQEAEIERVRCAFDGEEMVGCSRAYSFELTLPGGTRVPAAALSAVAVLPTHRRRGALTQMIEALHEDARNREEPAAILTASESTIYGRYGYGIATWRVGVSIERRVAKFRDRAPDRGRMRFLERDEAEKVLPGIYERTRDAPGAVSRPDFWWPSVFWGFFHGSDKAAFVAVHEDEHGRADGFVGYEIRGDWAGGLPDRELFAFDIQSTNPTAHAALWSYLFGIDLVGKISTLSIAIDDPVRFLLAEPRRLRIDYVNDGLWIAPLDSAALLAARTYTTEGSLVIEIEAPEGTRKRVALEGGPDGATATATKKTPDFTCSASTLGACVLGGNSWTMNARAGLAEEHTDGALRRADLMFAQVPAPATLSGF